MPQPASANLPAWAERAYTVVGHRPGLAVLAVLAAHDEPVSQQTILRAAGLNPQTASVALRRLEDAGVISGSIPRPQRPGPGVTWSVDRDQLARILAELANGLRAS